MLPNGGFLKDPGAVLESPYTQNPGPQDTQAATSDSLELSHDLDPTDTPGDAHEEGEHGGLKRFVLKCNGPFSAAVALQVHCLKGLGLGA